MHLISRVVSWPTYRSWEDAKPHFSTHLFTIWQIKLELAFIQSPNLKFARSTCLCGGTRSDRLDPSSSWDRRTPSSCRECTSWGSSDTRPECPLPRWCLGKRFSVRIVINAISYSSKVRKKMSPIAIMYSADNRSAPSYDDYECACG